MTKYLCKFILLIVFVVAGAAVNAQPVAPPPLPPSPIWTGQVPNDSSVYATPDLACQAQWKHYNPNATYEPAEWKGGSSADCHWTPNAQSNTILPAVAYASCPSGWSYSNPGICRRSDGNTEARPMCRPCSQIADSPKPRIGDPVELSTGALIEMETDYVSAEPRFGVRRHYYSLRPDYVSTVSPTAIAGFGARWHGIIPGRLTVTGYRAGAIEFLSENGDFSYFQSPNSDDQSIWTWYVRVRDNRRVSMVSIPTGVGRGDYFNGQDAIPNGPAEVRLDMADGEYILFRRSGPPSALRYLVAIEHGWPDGYKIFYTYPDIGEFPNDISDTFGRHMSITWVGADRENFKTFSKYNPIKVISQVKLPDNSILNYNYGSDIDEYGSTIHNRLEGVKRQSSDGSMLWGRNFLYENPNVAYGLTGETDQNGNRLSSFTYDASGLIASSEQAGGANRYEITNLEDSQPFTSFIRKVKNPLGLREDYFFYKVQNSYDSERLLDNIQRYAGQDVNASSSNYGYHGYIQDVVLKIIADNNGNHTYIDSDSRGRPTSSSEAYGNSQSRTTNTTWDPVFDLPRSVQTAGLTTDYSYSATGLLQQVILTDTTSQAAPYSTQGQKRTWTYSWNGNGRLSSINGPKGSDINGNDDVSSFAYDSAGNLLSATNAVGQATIFGNYDANGRPGRMTDPNGVDTTFVYDALGRLSASTVRDPGNNASLNAVTQFTYNAEGRVTGITMPATDPLTIDYDLAGRVVAVRAASGERIAYTRDGMGNATNEVINRANGTAARSISRVFDGLGRMVSETLGTNRTMTWTYDNVGNVLSTSSARSNATLRAFDGLNRLVSTVAPDQGATSTTYDDHDGVTSFVDARSVSTAFVRNGFGEVIQEASPDRGTSVYYYDAAGDRIAEIDGRGQRVNYVRDALGRVTSKVPVGRPSSEAVTYIYDAAGLSGSYGKGHLASVVDATGTTRFKYDHRGNLLVKQQVIGTSSAATLGYTYDLANRVTAITYPSGRVVSYVRDSKGRVVAVKTRPRANGADVTLASGLSYEAFGSLLKATLGNGLTLSQNWGDDGRLASKRLYRTSGGANLSSLTYAYDNDDNISAITDAVTPANSVAFAYDNVGRLSQIVSSGGALKRQDVKFDLNGNRTRIDYRSNSTDADPASSQVLTLAAGTNRLASVGDGMTTRSIGYDGRGNTANETRSGSITVTAGYDGYGRLTNYRNSAASTLMHAYNGLDDRVSTATTTGSTTDTRRFVYDADGRLLGEYGASASAVKAETIWLSPVVGDEGRSFGGDDGVGGYAPLALAVGNALYWVHGSHLGVPLVTTTSTGATANPAGFTRVGFPGQTQTTSDIYYNRYRDYDSSLGRYIQADPIGLDGGDNPYAYAGNNPLRWTDPMGLCPMCLVIPAVCAGGGCETLGVVALGALWWATHPFDLRKSPYNPPRSPPNTPSGPNCDSDDDGPCEVQEQRDVVACNSWNIKGPYGGYGRKGGFAACMRSVAQRYAECRARAHNPALITTPLFLPERWH